MTGQKIPKPKPNPDTRHLSPEEVASLRSQQFIINFQRHILNSLEKEFTRTLEDEHGVDLTKEVWELDLDKGELRRGSDTQQQRRPDPSENR